MGFLRAFACCVVFVAELSASAAPAAIPAVLGEVGPAPRGFASLRLSTPQLRTQLVAFDGLITVLGGKPFASCQVATDHLDRVTVAIGEPLRIAAELDGEITAAEIRCVLGDALMDRLTAAGVVVRDRAHGVAIELHPQAASIGTVAIALRAHLAVGTDNVAVVRLGPAARPLWLQLAIRDPGSQLRVSGPAIAGHSARIAAALTAMVAATPPLGALGAHDEHGELVVAVPTIDATIALAVRTNLLEAFRLPSTSTVPTLLIGDHVFVLKGPLALPLVPGDVVAYRHEDRTYLKRYVAGPGQVVSEDEHGQIAIDGKPIGERVVDPRYTFTEVDDRDPAAHIVAARRARTALAGHTFEIVHAATGSPHAGSWTVSPGGMFLLGDNRENSNDSRFSPSTADDLIGTAIMVWFAQRDGVPDWNRMGAPLDAPGH